MEIAAAATATSFTTQLLSRMASDFWGSKLCSESLNPLNLLNSKPKRGVVTMKVTADLRAAYLAEESYWKQRSRLLWLRLGDRNSGFFHSVTKGRRRANMFSVIEDEQGAPVYKEEQIAQVIVEYFGKLFSSSATNSTETVSYALDPGKSTCEIGKQLGLTFRDGPRSDVGEAHEPRPREYLRKARLEHEKDLEEGSTIRTSRRVCSTKIKVRGERVDQLEEVDRSHKGSFILISDKLS
ncbi:hypothetical protein YC2023_044939 [Brassica napus]